jgi:pilus assembly protein Flp/PilA
MFKSIAQFFRDEEGASAVEYGLVIGLIAVALVVVLGLIGGSTEDGTGIAGLFQQVADAIPTGN